uniref:EGF-like domain-containing protein n=1 Tax=Globodera rostochiensis TaxID=31243 RepID=A0A914HML9_GLORO
MHWNKEFSVNYPKFISSLLLICVVLIFCQSAERTAVDALRIEFKPRDWQSQLKNQTNKWEKQLKGHAIKRARKITKLDQLPDIPKERVQRIIKLQTSKNQYNPCRVVQNLCLNGGTCHAVDGEWFCNCSSKHYGRSCEFLADQSKCDENLCKNNATCYSVKEPRTVPNTKLTPKDVEKCSKNEVKTGKKDGDSSCAFTVTAEYQCWCKLGFEGDFCEFSEGERCCVEDHCNHHGLITDLFHASDAQTCDSGKHCNCTCEENYTGSNCEQVSPCRDLECLNEGKCVFNASVSDEAHCQCPTLGFSLGGVKISGNYCEKIEFDEQLSCNPCGNGGFRSYLNCLRKSVNGIEDKFAKYCGTGLCTDKLGKAFCLNEGQCQVTVANFTDLNPYWPLLLIPMCQCDSERFEGDFCEHELLDECDKKDLSLNLPLFVNVTAERRVSTAGTEEFLRELKNNIFGANSKISVGDSEDRRLASRGFEHILGRAGMRTFCGENGFCRPYNEEAGFECKCNDGFKGTRCEVRDPCSNTKCPDHSLCVDIPALDESNSPNEQNNLTSACICKTNQDINEKTSACMNQQNEYAYTACFNEGQPKCQNNGHCYPCSLDNELVSKIKVDSSRLPLCNQDERNSRIRCICPPGFTTSSLCHNESRPCDFNRCQNDAKCVAVPVPDNVLNYECECKPGYNGSLCEIVEDACRAGATCGNGTCLLDVTLARGFRCDCVYGYFGFDCEQIRATGWVAYFNDNYQWTYPLLAFLLLAPVNLVVVAVQERRTRAKYGALENAPSYYAVLSNYVN